MHLALWWPIPCMIGQVHLLVYKYVYTVYAEHLADFKLGD